MCINSTENGYQALITGLWDLKRFATIPIIKNGAGMESNTKIPKDDPITASVPKRSTNIAKNARGKYI